MKNTILWSFIVLGLVGFCKLEAMEGNEDQKHTTSWKLPCGDLALSEKERRSAFVLQYGIYPPSARRPVPFAIDDPNALVPCRVKNDVVYRPKSERTEIYERQRVKQSKQTEREKETEKGGK